MKEILHEVFSKINVQQTMKAVTDKGIEKLAAAAVRSDALHIKYNELKQRVNAAQTVEEVEAIHWSAEGEGSK